MVKQYKHIEIVRSTTVSISSMSRESCDAIYAVLSGKYVSVGVTIVNSVSDLQSLVDNPPDLVFLGMGYVPVNLSLGIDDPDKIWISDFLDAHGITHTGSNSEAYYLQRNKDLAKQTVLTSGLSTSDYCVVNRGEQIKESDIKIPYPLFVKPRNKGGGLGIDSGSVVHDFKQLVTRVKTIADVFHSDSLIEQYLTGREFSVAILKDALLESHLVMPIELLAPEDENGAKLLSGKVKSDNAEQAIEVTNRELHDEICQFALGVFSALGAQDYGRIDIRLDSEGRPQFLEANLLPSLISGYGSFPKACLINQNLGYEDMINQIVDIAMSRGLKPLEILKIDQTIDSDIYPTAGVLLKPA